MKHGNAAVYEFTFYPDPWGGNRRVAVHYERLKACQASAPLALHCLKYLVAGHAICAPAYGGSAVLPDVASTGLQLFQLSSCHEWVQLLVQQPLDSTGRQGRSATIWALHRCMPDPEAMQSGRDWLDRPWPSMVHQTESWPAPVRMLLKLLVAAFLWRPSITGATFICG